MTYAGSFDRVHVHSLTKYNFRALCRRWQLYREQLSFVVILEP